MMQEPADFLRDSMRDFDRAFHASMAWVWKIVLTFISLTVYITGLRIGVGETTSGLSHFVYIFCHANIFHLMGNTLCLWRIRPRMHMPEAVIIATAVTWLPLLTGDNVTMGMSGVLFAVCGIQWGKLHRFWGMLKYCGVIIAVTALIPNMSWAVHAYSLFAGFAYGWILGIRHKELWR